MPNRTDEHDRLGRIRYFCEKCSNEIIMAAQFSGRRARCSACGKVFTVPKEPKPALWRIVGLALAAGAGLTADTYGNFGWKAPVILFLLVLCIGVYEARENKERRWTLRRPIHHVLAAFAICLPILMVLGYCIHTLKESATEEISPSILSEDSIRDALKTPEQRSWDSMPREPKDVSAEAFRRMEEPLAAKPTAIPDDEHQTAARTARFLRLLSGSVAAEEKRMRLATSAAPLARASFVSSSVRALGTDGIDREVRDFFDKREAFVSHIKQREELFSATMGLGEFADHVRTIDLLMDGKVDLRAPNQWAMLQAYSAKMISLLEQQVELERSWSQIQAKWSSSTEFTDLDLRPCIGKPTFVGYEVAGVEHSIGAGHNANCMDADLSALQLFAERMEGYEDSWTTPLGSVATIMSDPKSLEIRTSAYLAYVVRSHGLSETGSSFNNLIAHLVEGNRIRSRRFHQEVESTLEFLRKWPVAPSFLVNMRWAQDLLATRRESRKRAFEEAESFGVALRRWVKEIRKAGAGDQIIDDAIRWLELLYSDVTEVRVEEGYERFLGSIEGENGIALMGSFTRRGAQETIYLEFTINREDGSLTGFSRYGGRETVNSIKGTYKIKDRLGFEIREGRRLRGPLSPSNPIWIFGIGVVERDGVYEFIGRWSESNLVSRLSGDMSVTRISLDEVEIPEDLRTKARR